MNLWPSTTEKYENLDFFQKVAGEILDFMATFWGHGNGFFRRRKKKQKIWFSKCRSDNFRGPNRRILGQGIGQNLVWTIFEKVQKPVFFQLCGQTQKNLVFLLFFVF